MNRDLWSSRLDPLGQRLFDVFGSVDGITFTFLQALTLP